VEDDALEVARGRVMVAASEGSGASPTPERPIQPRPPTTLSSAPPGENAML